MKNLLIVSFWVEGGVWVRERITSATSWTGGCELGWLVWCGEGRKGIPGSSIVVALRVLELCVYVLRVNCGIFDV